MLSEFQLFTSCPSSAVRVRSGSGSFQGQLLGAVSCGSVDLCHHLIKPSHAAPCRFNYPLSKSLLKLICITKGKGISQIYELAFGVNSQFIWIILTKLFISSLPTTSHHVVCRANQILPFIITLFTQISAPRRCSLTSRPVWWVCRLSQSGCDCRWRWRREFNWMSQLVSSCTAAKGQRFFVFFL